MVSTIWRMRAAGEPETLPARQPGAEQAMLMRTRSRFGSDTSLMMINSCIVALPTRSRPSLKGVDGGDQQVNWIG